MRTIKILGLFLIALMFWMDVSIAGEKMPIPAVARPEGEILKFTAKNNSDEKGRRNVFFCFSEAEYKIEDGDFLEFDACIKGNSPDIVGSLELEFSDGGALRSLNASDQFGISSHPGSTPGKTFAGRWLRRIFDLKKCVGKTIKKWEVALATDEVKKGVYTVYLDNVRIANSGKTVKEIYSDGKPEVASPNQSSILEDFELTNVKISGEKIEPEFTFDISDYECLTPNDDNYADNPGIASDGKGKVWVVWLRRPGNDKENVVLNEYTGKWSDGINVTQAEGKYESPLIACVPGGKPMIVWIKIDGEKWIIESSIFDGKKFSIPVTAVSGPGKAYNPCFIAGNNDSFWLGWESYEKGKFKVCIKPYVKGRWEEAIQVTTGESNSYDPAIALDQSPKGSGKVWVAYSFVENKERNLYLNSYDINKKTLGVPVKVAGSGKIANANGFPSIFCDREGRVWITWETRSSRGTSRRQECVFGNKECYILCYFDGKLWEVEPQADGFLGKKVFKNDNDRLPVFVTDSSGRLWLFIRRWAEARRTWSVRASFLESDSGWLKPAGMIDALTLGRIDRPAVAIADKNSFWIVWQGDDYWAKDVPTWETKSDIYIARILQPLPAKENKPVKFTESSLQESTGTIYGRPWIERRKVKVGKEEYTLLLGNLHEHTYISRCDKSGVDGTFDDNYRYGMNYEGYDFICMTDHGYDLHEVNWLKTRRAAQFYNDPPYFFGLPSYEWTLSAPTRPVGSGHRNVFFVSDEDAAKFISGEKSLYDRNTERGNRIDLLWQILRDKNLKDVVTIPHHPADKDHPMDWNFHDPEYQTVVEIYQVRLSSEHKNCPQEIKNLTSLQGCYVQDALARGYRMGFIASGDHSGMGIGLAALLVKEPSRQGIIEALKSRRCFGTTGDKIFVDFRIDGHIMGEEFKTTGKPHITATIEAVRPLKNIVIFKNNNVIFEKKESDINSALTFNVDFVDENFDSVSYYYLRAIQDNNEIVWSSPIWVDK